MVDIIVRARNGHELTAACLRSIRENTPAGTYRVILCDDGSDPALDDECDYLVRSRESHGAVSCTNMGLGVSLGLDGDYILVLDNDTEIPAGDTEWLARFVSELEGCGPKTAAVGATTSYANPPQHILKVPQTYTADWSNGSRANPTVVWFVSFAVLLRKSAVRECGLWDTRYDPGNWEDTDYSVTLRRAGHEIRVARSVYVHHRGSRTFGAQLQALMRSNAGKFQEKWGTGLLWDMGYFTNAEIAMGLTDLLHGQQVFRPVEP